MSIKPRRYVPRLEALDDRSLPSVSALIVPGSTILEIDGDNTVNTITIRDSGQSGGVTVVADGQTFQFDDAITAIVVNTFDGNDVVQYDLMGTLAGLRSIDVELGRGTDTFTANLTNQTLGPTSYLALSAYGRGGGDTLVLNAQGVSVDPTSTLNVYFAGSAGKDTIAFNCSPDLLSLPNVFLQKDQRH
jgi:hypothetical protein